MNYPKVQFIKPNSENLANYLCYLAKQISCHFYQDRRFLVLPRPIERESRLVYFPDLAYDTKFWGCFQSLDQTDFVFQFNPKIVNATERLLQQPLQDHLLQMAPQSQKIESVWKDKERAFFHLVNQFLPKLPLNKVKNISVLVTPFGTVSSFFFIRRGQNFDFRITVREDFGAVQIAEAVLTLLSWIEHPTPNLALWYQVESNVDFLLAKSKLGEPFNFDFVPTVSGLPEIPDGLVAESETYLSKIGFPIKPILSASIVNPASPAGRCEPVLTVDSHLVYNTFTPSEKRILINLITHKNQLITYDQIGNWFWGESEEALEKFNLYSVAKIMEKIRKKIKDQGIYQELIYTVRGQGYVLYD